MSPGDPIKLAALIAEVLDDLEIRYVIGGSVAASIYGEPRTTLDLDLMIEANERQVVELTERLRQGFYVDQADAVNAVRSSSSFSVIHLGTSMKVDFFLAEREVFATEQLNRRRAIDIGGGVSAWFYAPEDLIVRKLLCFRAGGEQSQRQWRDVVGILRIAHDGIDFEYLRRAATARRLLDLVERAIADADRASR